MTFVFLFFIFYNPKPNSNLLFNEKFIEALQSDLDYKNSEKVFEFVFSNLDNQVTVYPSENYYYFEIFAGGKSFNGAIGLFADIIDDGRVMFGYAERQIENQTQQNSYTIYLNQSDGLGVEKIDSFKYVVSYKSKNVVFNFNQLNITKPSNLKLYESEKFVAPVLDESGLKFLLVYNKEINGFYWILDENYSKISLTNIFDNILVDRRTQFIFYNETGRKVLIGVNRNNVMANNWYDGPFDQIPYNYVKTGEIEIKPYIDLVYPKVKNTVDRYGKFIGTDNRVAISPYTHYSEIGEIVDKVTVCERSNQTLSIYECITKKSLK